MAWNSGAALISDIIPGLGAIHTQSYWNQQNQDQAHQKLLEGYTAEEIINWLIDNDAENNSSIRQYGAISLINDSIKQVPILEKIVLIIKIIL